MVRMGKTMAKKSKPAAKKGDDLVTIAGWKGTVEFQGWVERLCRHVRLPLPVMLEHAAIELAKSRGFEEDPPQRLNDGVEGRSGPVRQ